MEAELGYISKSLGNSKPVVSHHQQVVYSSLQKSLTALTEAHISLVDRMAMFEQEFKKGTYTDQVQSHR